MKKLITGFDHLNFEFWYMFRLATSIVESISINWYANLFYNEVIYRNDRADLPKNNQIPFYQTYFGAWRSLVARLLWEQEVGGSNPLAPTNKFKHLERVLVGPVLFFLFSRRWDRRYSP